MFVEYSSPPLLDTGLCRYLFRWENLIEVDSGCIANEAWTTLRLIISGAIIFEIFALEK